MPKFVALLALSCLVAPALGAPHNTLQQYSRLFAPMKIVGGKPAELGQFPHQISYQIESSTNGWMHYCGGSIVTPTLIVTASHCLEHGLSDAKTRVLAGVLDNEDLTSGQVLTVKRSQQHPSFTMFFYIKNDIAFLELNEPIEFNENVQPIKVARPGQMPSTKSRACTASGWGNSVFGGPTSQYLNFVDIDYIQDSDCEDQWGWFGTIFPEQNVCAGTDAGGESVCQGDSGGPLICEVEGGTDGEYVLFGATSWGSSTCGQKNRPAIWAEVPYFLQWIEDTAGVTLPVA